MASWTLGQHNLLLLAAISFHSLLECEWLALLTRYCDAIRALVTRGTVPLSPVRARLALAAMPRARILRQPGRPAEGQVRLIAI